MTKPSFASQQPSSSDREELRFAMARTKHTERKSESQSLTKATKPFRCPDCAKEFLQLSNMNRHRESLTAKVQTEDHWTSKRKRSTLGTTPSRRKVNRRRRLPW